MSFPLRNWSGAALLAALLLGCAAHPPAPDYGAIVSSPDRSEADRTNDTRRKVLEMMQYIDVRPGMTVADLDAAAGYTTELLARAVGPTGKVYAQNTRNAVENMIKGRFEERMKKPVMKNVVHVIRPFDDPLPPEVRDLDLVTFNFGYHDTVYEGVDRARMNRAVFNALKSGGTVRRRYDRSQVATPHRGSSGTPRSGSGGLSPRRRRRILA